MKKKMLYKDAFREIKKSFGRFFSIFAISALGVAFFAGVTSSSDAMKYNADLYFDHTNYQDFHLLSTIGFTEEDAKELAKMSDVDQVLKVKSFDVLSTVKASEYVFKVFPIPEEKNSVNKITLVTGRMPQNTGECLIEDSVFDSKTIALGDSLTFRSGTDTLIEENVHENTCTVVGTAKSPLYLSYEQGTSSIGDGSVDALLFLPEENIKVDYYTDLYVTIKGAKKENSYQESYFDLLNPIASRLENKGKTLVDSRIEEIKEEARKQLDEKKQEFENQKNLFEQKIAEGEAQIEQGKEEILLGRVKLETQKISYEQQMKDGQQQIEDAKKALEEGKTAYETQKAMFEELQNQVNSNLPILKEELEKQKASIEEQKKALEEINQKLEDPNISEEDRTFYENQKKILEANIETAEKYLPIIESQIQNLQNQLASAEQKLKQAEEQMVAGQKAIEDAEKKLAAGKVLYEQEIKKAEAEVSAAEKKIEESEKTLEESKKNGQKELDLAQEQLTKAEADIAKETDDRWYVLDRKSDYSYMDYESAADRMDAIATIFPIFFFLVAALVCLTTITRMVEEQRVLIGTYKALGYRRYDILTKYLLYAATASFFGGILGAILGMTIFPNVIYSVWNIMYNLPEYQYIFDWQLGIFAILLMTLVSMLTTFLSVRKEMKEVPASLMRPEAPKVGKKIFLERIPLIWNHLDFLKKVTARNIFRYKKRFFMTVIGISGCTALLVAGFGIRDSIREIVPVQFGEIFKYDGLVSYENTNSYVQNEELYQTLKENEHIKDSIQVLKQAGEASYEEETQNVTLMVPEQTKDLEDFLSFRDRITQQEISLEKNDVIVTEKLAKELKCTVGDTITLTIDDEQVSLTIKDITENYIDHYIYLNPTIYKETFLQSVVPNTMLIKLDEKSDAVEREVGDAFMKQDGVVSVSFYTSVAQTFENMISSLNLVTVVLLIAAGILAFIVLYNLTNVNVSERIREIATIKVLGFYDREVNSYVYRENIVLTMIGALVGLFLGAILHLFIMNVAEFDTVMFGRKITWISFTISFLITIFFALFVNLCMRKKLKEISMVESLKSVD